MLRYRAIAEHGVDALSLRDVARDAGTTTPAIYSLFGSKHGLLGALGVRAFDLLRREAEALPATEEPAADLVTAALMFRRFALEHPALLAIAFHRANPAISPRLRSARLEARKRRCSSRSSARGWRGGYELRGTPPLCEAERFWRNAVPALISGFATTPEGSPQRRRRGRTTVGGLTEAAGPAG